MKETINKAAHTPGPWTADKLTNRGHNGAYYWHIQDKEGDEGQLIALVPSLYAGTTFPETEEANARLIAAAPTMLDVLKLVRLNMVGECLLHETNPLVLAMDNAIHLATGGGK